MHIKFNIHSLVGKESVCNARRPEFHPLVRKIPWKKEWLPTPVFLPGEIHSFSAGSDGKALACNAGDLGSIPGWGRSPGEGNGNSSLQYSCLGNPMDRGAWQATVHGVTKSRTRLSDFTFTFHFHALEKEMATHSSVLAWRIPGKGDSGGLPSMGSHRVGHN